MRKAAIRVPLLVRPGAYSKLATILAVGLTVQHAKAEEIRRDGNWWRTTTREFRLSYMVGFSDGIWLGWRFSSVNLRGKDGQLDATEVIRVGRSFDKSLDLIENLTNLQVVDGLDKFYTDYRNRRIRVLEAVWIVLQSINGTPDNDMEILIENARKSAAVEQ